jgi:hypothetical protein
VTEAEWLACDDPQTMVASLRGRASGRKLRLFACAVARSLPPAADAAEGRERDRAVEVAERFADGRASADELRRALICTASDGVWTAAHPNAFEAAEVAATETHWSGRPAVLTDLLRELFGNPFRPRPRPDPAWLAWNGGTVYKLAEAVYEGRAFDRFPVLADALEDAGCANADMLGHLRGPGPHVHGCWAVDLLLGKE